MAMFTSLGAAIASALGMAGPITAGTAAAIGTTAAVAGTAAAVAGSSQIIKASMPKTPEPSAMFALPEVPKTVTEPASEVIAKSEEKAQAAVRQKQVAARRSRSVYSSPLGLAGEATTVRKTLLGH